VSVFSPLYILVLGISIPLDPVSCSLSHNRSGKGDKVMLIVGMSQVTAFFVM
jgi:hypothetical protein